VKSGNGYQINCPVATPDTIDLAIELTQQALDKIRGSGTN
jgi:predicted N-acetyltransferase YhbS